MQFKHPELLWALIFLLFPIFIHLFQLRKFKKTPFTNVKLLEQLVIKSRKSSTLKKWLLLAVRLLLAAAVILAFAQPFEASRDAAKKREVVVYLDNSLSMQARKSNTPLLQLAVQDLLTQTPAEQVLSVFTNDLTYSNTNVRNIQPELLNLGFSKTGMDLEAVRLKAETLFSRDSTTIKQLILVSDFQSNTSYPLDSLSELHPHIIQLLPDSRQNVVLDTAYWEASDSENLELKIGLSAQMPTDVTIPVSLFNGEKLIGKIGANFEGDRKASVQFTLPKDTTIMGRIAIVDSGLDFDNELFFVHKKQEKIKVLVLTEREAEFYQRIFTPDLFELRSLSLNQLDYALLQGQQLIVLHELPRIVPSLQTALQEYLNAGGSLAVVPTQEMEVQTYTSLLAPFGLGYREWIPQEQPIAHISMEHPLFRNVFTEKVANFDYPSTQGHFVLSGPLATALEYPGSQPFLASKDQLYLFASPINSTMASITRSPLIVPAFFNMAMQSLRMPELYFAMNQPSQVDILAALGKEEVLRLEGGAVELIPRQQSFGEKVSLFFSGEVPQNPGRYTVTHRDTVLARLAFNQDRKESSLNYLELSDSEAYTTHNSLGDLFTALEKERAVNAYWKWFVIFALIMLVLETLIQKHLR